MPRLKSRAPVCSENVQALGLGGGRGEILFPAVAARTSVHMRRRSSGAIAAMLMCVMLSAAAAPLMHDLPQDTVMHAFLRAQGSEAHLLVEMTKASAST
jgi:hypothetical protein